MTLAKQFVGSRLARCTLMASVVLLSACDRRPLHEHFWTTAHVPQVGSLKDSYPPATTSTKATRDSGARRTAVKAYNERTKAATVPLRSHAPASVAPPVKVIADPPLSKQPGTPQMAMRPAAPTISPSPIPPPPSPAAPRASAAPPTIAATPPPIATLPRPTNSARQPASVPAKPAAPSVDAARLEPKALPPVTLPKAVAPPGAPSRIAPPTPPAAAVVPAPSSSQAPAIPPAAPAAQAPAPAAAPTPPAPPQPATVTPAAPSDKVASAPAPSPSVVPPAGSPAPQAPAQAPPPAAAPPAAAPSGAATGSIAKTVEEARALFQSGEVLKARERLQSAGGSNGNARNPDLLLELARTYDPAYLDRLTKKDGNANAALARALYEQAAQFGSSAAAFDLLQLRRLSPEAR